MSAISAKPASSTEDWPAGRVFTGTTALPDCLSTLARLQLASCMSKSNSALTLRYLNLFILCGHSRAVVSYSQSAQGFLRKFL